MDWGDKLKSRLNRERDRLRADPGAQFAKSRLLENLALELGLSRRSGEQDNELFSRIESHPEFEKQKELLMRARGIDSRLVSKEKVEAESALSFMDELKKL